jgi:hypothetical protein
MSEAMVLAASIEKSPEETVVELLDPPANSKIGERIQVEGYTKKGLEPDAVINPKHKLYPDVVADLKTNNAKVATYKDAVFSTTAGPVTVASLKDAKIR